MSRLADPEKKKALCARLARIEGQLRGLQKLIEQGDQSADQVAEMLTKFA